MSILVSELGDKTFFLTMILALRRGRAVALIAALSSLWALVLGLVGVGCVRGIWHELASPQECGPWMGWSFSRVQVGESRQQSTPQKVEIPHVEPSANPRFEARFAAKPAA
eukprot:980013-Amphidinium_carterae.1